MSEQELNDKGFFIEPYGGGFILADYRDDDRIRYCGSDLSWRKQPITYLPFISRFEAVNVAGRLIVNG